MRWTPGKGYFILPEHLNRLRASADYFNIDCNIEQVNNYLRTQAEDFSTAPQKVRLLLHNDGRLEGTFTSIDPPPSAPLKIRLASQPVDSQNALLYHKTTQRQIYEACLAEKNDADEVVLWNERGEVTECCTANLVIEMSGKMLTPPVASGLLPGTYREYLLRRGVLTEQVLTLDDLRNSSRVYLINAVRKWRRAVFCA